MLTRLCAVAALRGKTWADDRVFDSDNTPLSAVLTTNEAAKPYIVVYTDSDNRPEISGTDLYGCRRELNLSLEIGVASKIEGATGGVTIRTPLTDEGMEIALDMVEDQAIACLFGDPQSDWAELLKGFVLKVERVAGQRGASGERDRRWAARQLSIVCDVISDFPPGLPIPDDHPIRRFSEVSQAHPEAKMDHAGEICEALINRSVAPDWLQLQATLGLRRIGLRAMGSAPLSSDFTIMASAGGADLTDTDNNAPILRKISSDDMQMEHDPDHGLIDDYSIETNVAKVKVKETPDKIKSDGELDG
jgi:hypothetical protein